MKHYVFGIGVLLMLSFSLTGLAHAAAGTLRRFDVRFAPLLSLALGVVALIALMTALAWSVPPRG